MYHLLLSILVGLQIFHVSFAVCQNGIPIIPKLSTTTTTSTTSTTTTTPTTTTTSTTTTTPTTTTTTTTTPAPTTTTTTTTPPPAACTTCGTLGFAPPPPEYSIVASGGFISPSNNAAGCKQYFVGCYEYADKAIIIGANQQFLPLSLGTPGAKSVILTCNNAGQIQGQMWGNGDAIVPITSVYCSRQI